MTRRFLWVLLTLLSYYRRHPGQAAFMALGLVTGVALWSAVQLINQHARAGYGAADRLLGAQASHWIRSEGRDGVAPAAYLALRHAGFTGVYPVVETRLRAASGELLQIIATDLLALPAAGGTDGSGADNPFTAEDWLPLIQPPYQAWYPESLARRLGVAPGDRLTLANGQRLPPAVLRSRSEQGARLFMDVGAALAVLELRNFSYLAVAGLEPGEGERLREALPAGLVLVPNRQALDLRELTASLHTNLTAMGLLSFAVGMFIVFNAVRFSLLARREIQTTLRELGVSVRLLAAAIAAESLLWSAAGALGGLALGQFLAQRLLPAVATSLQGLYGATLGEEIAPGAAGLALAFALTLAGVALALALPLLQRLGEPVLQARSLSAELDREREGLRRAAAAAAALALLALVACFTFRSVVGGFVLLALALFAGALLLAPLLSASIGLLARLLSGNRWLLRWSVSDARAQLPFLRVALMALLLTYTANIGVTTLVSSFRTALDGWLQNRLSATLYVQSDTLDGGRLQGQDWLLHSHARLGVSLRFADRPAELYGLDPAAPDTRGLPLAAALPEALADWRSGRGSPAPILASEQVRYLAGYAPGAIVELESPGGPQRFRIVGFFHDYGNAGFRFYLPRSTVAALWPQAGERGLALWLREGAEEAAVAALLAAGARPGEWTRQEDLRSISFSIFDRTFAITGALNGLTLLVAGLALFSGLMSLHQARLPEYSHWRALGLRSGEWLTVVALPLLLMVLGTGLLSLPLGALLSWLLIDRLNVAAFGWTMPMRWSWVPAGQLAAVSAVIVTATLALAAARVRRALPEASRRPAGPGA